MFAVFRRTSTREIFPHKKWSLMLSGEFGEEGKGNCDSTLPFIGQSRQTPDCMGKKTYQKKFQKSTKYKNVRIVRIVCIRMYSYVFVRIRTYSLVFVRIICIERIVRIRTYSYVFVRIRMYSYVFVCIVRIERIVRIRTY